MARKGMPVFMPAEKCARNSSSRCCSCAGSNNTAINNNGRATVATVLGGVFTGDGGSLTTITTAAGPLASFDEATFNDSGAVAFHATFDGGGAGIFRGAGGPLQTIADSSGPLTFDGSFGRHAAINNAGLVAFMASLDAGGQGVFISNGGPLQTIITTGGPITGFDDQGIQINASGSVAFKAITTSGVGLFTNLGGSLQLVIEKGDPLFGASVSSIGFGWSGLNDSGQMSFFATLDDGRVGIYRADPPVPEPSTLLLLGTGVIAILRRTRR